MMLSGFFLVVAASLVLLDRAATAQGDNREVILTEGATCLKKMNEARQKANLEELKLKQREEALPSQGKSPSDIWVDVCKTLLDKASFTPSAELALSGTYALFKLSEGEQGEEGQATVDESQCSDAVEEWQGGFSKFEEDSTANTKVEYAQANPKQVSFVTLYNPNSDAEGQCSVATCTIPDPTRDTSKKRATGLVCLTTPNAFDRTPLFEVEEWNEIKEAFKPSMKDEQKVTITDGNNCLTNLNAAREEAGLEKLEPKKAAEATFKEAKAPEGVFVAVCAHLLEVGFSFQLFLSAGKFKGKEFKPSDELVRSETYALLKLSEVQPSEDNRMMPTEPQCSAAVEKWKEGFKTFEDDPPTNKMVDYSRATPTQVSFVTLYNPDSAAKGQCVVATCTGTPKEQSNVRSYQPASETASALVCSTDPNAFRKASLFTQNQWNKIKEVFVNSASAALPSVLALATVLAATV